MTSADTTPTGGSATCGFPGCEQPVRARAGEGRGKPPSYCDLVNPATRKPAHTPLTAVRERAKLQRQGATGQSAAQTVEAPASASRGQAATLFERFQTLADELKGVLDASVGAMTSAGDPENVSAELAAARRTVERTRLESDERIQAIELARDEALADAEAARRAAGEATAARDEAIGELDTAEAALADVQAELEQARTGHAAELERLRAEHVGELDRVRSEAELQLTDVRAEAAKQVIAADQRAADQIRTAEADAAQRVQAAEAAREQAVTDATAASQAASDATSRAVEAREELRQARTDHRDELAALRREHRDELGAERKRSDTAAEILRGEHRREVEALQEALTAPRATVAQQGTAQPPERKRR